MFSEAHYIATSCLVQFCHINLESDHSWSVTSSDSSSTTISGNDGISDRGKMLLNQTTFFTPQFIMHPVPHMASFCTNAEFELHV